MAASSQHHLFLINPEDPSSAELLKAASMSETESLYERHLEEWVIANPSAIDPTMMVVTQQLSSWVTEEDLVTGRTSLSERLDVLGITADGEVIVVELKRSSDRLVHVQALTYAALVDGISLQTLAELHAEWRKRHEEKSEDDVTEDEIESALGMLADHIGIDDLTDAAEIVFENPRIALVAEEFPLQVLTTVTWLHSQMPHVTITCHQFQLYEAGKDRFMTMTQIFPFSEGVDEVTASSRFGLKKHAISSKRAVKSGVRSENMTTIIARHNLVEDGTPFTFHPEKAHKTTEERQQAQEWLESPGHPERRHIVWDTEVPNKPLRWGAAPDEHFAPGGLSEAIFRAAGVDRRTNYAGPRVFSAFGYTIPQIAQDPTRRFTPDGPVEIEPEE